MRLVEYLVFMTVGGASFPCHLKHCMVLQETHHCGSWFSLVHYLLLFIAGSRYLAKAPEGRVCFLSQFEGTVHRDELVTVARV